MTTPRTTTLRAATRAYTTGIRDGFLAPYDASITTNVEHLDHALDNAQEVYDSGLNLGQFLRAGRASQAVQEGFPLRPPLPVRA